MQRSTGSRITAAPFVDEQDWHRRLMLVVPCESAAGLEEDDSLGGGEFQEGLLADSDASCG
jgi:hypothetical protein